MLVGTEALSAIGLTHLSLDLTLPALAPALLDAAEMPAPRRQALARALDRKDAAGVAEHGGSLAPVLIDLLMNAGPAPSALQALDGANLPAALRALAERLAAVVTLLHARAPNLRITIDPLEFRGFRYHTGIAVTVFAPGRHEELGRGGRYLSGDGEPATGLTLFADAVLRAAPPRPAPPTILVPAGTDPAIARALRARFATIAALSLCDPRAEALRLRCSHVLEDGVPRALGA
jgi:ATP phosphoribosyltransferase regulatory subunit